MDISLDLTSLRQAYAGGLSPVDVVNSIYDRIETEGLRPVWISLVPRQTALSQAAQLQPGVSNPLFGVPFAVKDNIDVAGMITTAGCPAYGRVAENTATVVLKLLEAGALLIGKTNLDQFATGLVGTRSPYGACSSVFDDRYVSGGSSSGSAVAVASGLVSFALGTDTAGSGRVPAAFNNLVGVKPTRGMVSKAGIVPACRSLDCVSLFALTAGDGATVLKSAAGFDPDDPWSRPHVPGLGAAPWAGSSFRFAVPPIEQLEFFEDNEADRLFSNAIAELEQCGGTKVEFDYQPFRDAAALLYSGPWVAERLAAVKDFYASNKEDIEPTVRQIMAGAERFTAVDAYESYYRLFELRRQSEAVWKSADIILLPTTGTIYTNEEVQADPVGLNSNLGYYTNFVNLLDLAAVALPAGFRENGLPFGVTIVGQARTDFGLLSIADRLHRISQSFCGRRQATLSNTDPILLPPAVTGCVLIAVVGAHLSGQPLNFQLTERGARHIRTTKTANSYKLYALPDTKPEKPGLIRVAAGSGSSLEVEVWAVPENYFGGFVAEVPPPLGIGTLELEDGSLVKGFICEPYAIQNAADITHFGGWRRYIASKI